MSNAVSTLRFVFQLENRVKVLKSESAGGGKTKYIIERCGILVRGSPEKLANDFAKYQSDQAIKINRIQIFLIPIFQNSFHIFEKYF